MKQAAHAVRILLPLLFLIGCGHSHTRYYTLYENNDASILTTAYSDERYLQSAVVTQVDGQRLTSGTLDEVHKKPVQEIELRPGQHVVVIGYFFWGQSTRLNTVTEKFIASRYSKVLQFDSKPDVKYVVRGWLERIPEVTFDSQSTERPQTAEPWEKEWSVWIEELAGGEVVAGNRPNEAKTR